MSRKYIHQQKKAKSGDDNSRLLDIVRLRGEQRKLIRQYSVIYDPAAPDVAGAYEWQAEFHAAGATNTERMLMAANRVGKTSCAAAEIACHATGKYPKWWTGRKFTQPVKIWCGGESTEAIRDIVQAALLGAEGQHGTGWLPKDAILEVKYRQSGVSNVVDSIYVDHPGGVSYIGCKSYEQGRTKWQGVSLDCIWLDEEPPASIYTEALTRILDRKGMMIMTFTPLHGATDVVMHFLEPRAPGIFVKNVTWDDAPHLDAGAKERLLLSYPEHERATRSKGEPMLGSGMIFPVPDDDITCDPFEIPKWWARINGCDFGIDHPGAGAFLAHDRQSDTVYLYDCYKATGQTPIYHAAALGRHGGWIPISWPHDGLVRDKGSGDTLKDLYRRHGAYMLREAAGYHDERGTHVEPGLIEMLEYMRLGKFKVWRTCTQFLEEKRMYHRRDGVVVKERDDIISACRYAFVMRRMAQTQAPSTASVVPLKPILGHRRWKTVGP
jgi:phage terminase large subunit-like protein